MIDEITIQKIKTYDEMFSTKSKVFPCTNTIIVETPLDSWCLEVSERQNKNKKNVCVFHKNRRGRRDKYHIQAWKNSLYDAYDSIFTHKRWLNVLKTPRNTYKKEEMNAEKI
jgi:hypothetical protein